jgi:hypothetical protein
MTNSSLSNTRGTGQGGTSATGASSAPTGDLRDDASTLASDASDAGRHVVGVAKDETRSVASETGRQARRFMGQVGDELRSQAATQQSRAAEGLRSVGSGFSEMANGSTQTGVAADLVRGAGERVNDVARWLDHRDPRSLVEEVKGFARRRPGVFIAIAVGAGVLAGRLTRAIASSSETSDGASYPTDRIDRQPRDVDFAAAPSVPPMREVPPPAATTVGTPTGGFGSAGTTGTAGGV